MKTLVLIVILSLATTAALPSLAHAEGSSCMATVSDKKLAGAAKTSFMKKCETDAKASCDAAAADKKLAGAAKATRRNASPTPLAHDGPVTSLHHFGLAFAGDHPHSTISRQNR